MALRIWGIALLVLGTLVLGAGLFGAFGARDLWQDAEAACAGSPDAWCGAGQSYAAILLLVLSPLATLAGALLLLAGGALLALARWLERKLKDTGLGALL